MTINDVKNLIIPSEFGCTDENDETYVMTNVFNQMRDFGRGNIDIKYGASKYVIIFDNEDKVVKIPFNGEYVWDWDEADNYEDYEGDFEPFYTKDYCALEEETYLKMEEAGFEKFFAKTECAGYTKSNTPYYVSEKVRTYCESEFDDEKEIPSEESSKRAREFKFKHNSFADYFPIDWLALAYDYYGFELVDNFIKYLDKNPIDDLHNNNIGYRFNGEPCILDYSGYYA